MFHKFNVSRVSLSILFLSLLVLQIREHYFPWCQKIPHLKNRACDLLHKKNLAIRYIDSTLTSLLLYIHLQKIIHELDFLLFLAIEQLETPKRKNNIEIFGFSFSFFFSFYFKVMIKKKKNEIQQTFFFSISFFFPSLRLCSKNLPNTWTPDVPFSLCIYIFFFLWKNIYTHIKNEKKSKKKKERSNPFPELDNPPLFLWKNPFHSEPKKKSFFF